MDQPKQTKTDAKAPTYTFTANDRTWKVHLVVDAHVSALSRAKAAKGPWNLAIVESDRDEWFGLGHTSFETVTGQLWDDAALDVLGPTVTDENRIKALLTAKGCKGLRVGSATVPLDTAINKPDHATARDRRKGISVYASV